LAIVGVVETVVNFWVESEVDKSDFEVVVVGTTGYVVTSIVTLVTKVVEFLVVFVCLGFRCEKDNYEKEKEKWG